eukprot:s4261_g2.t1
MKKALLATVRPGRCSEFQALADAEHGGDAKKLVAKLVQLSRTLCVRKVAPKDEAKYRSIICKGHVGYGLALYVFSYDQRIPNSQWDEHTVLCRALTVIIPLPDHLRDAEEGTPLDISHLEAALHPESSVPMKIAECMPKFWEADPNLLSDMEKAFGKDPAVIGVAAAMEKVDGSLGTLHPARDPQTLEPLSDAPPILSSKSVGWSPAIARHREMLLRQHPQLHLPAGVSSAVVEVVAAESQVCVPYSYEGFRLLAMMENGRWLTEEELDDRAASLGIARPKRYPLDQFKTSGGYASAGGPVAVADILRKAQSYAMPAEPGALQEGWVVVLNNGLRLKVHTEVWNIIHGWWSNRISPLTVAPLLYDTRIKHVPFEIIRECLCGPLAPPKRIQNAEDLAEMLEVMRPRYAECMASARNALKESANMSMKQLKDHPSKKLFQFIRGKQKWVDSIPAEVDVDTMEIPFEAIRDGFVAQLEAQLRQLSEEKDVDSINAVPTKLLQAICLCLESLQAGSTISELEADLGKSIPVEVLPLIATKNAVDASATSRLKAALARRDGSFWDAEK